MVTESGTSETDGIIGKAGTFARLFFIITSDRGRRKYYQISLTFSSKPFSTSSPETISGLFKTSISPFAR